DGNIECLGRADNQVKIRGFRIELGEIEAALTAHSEVERAVVIAREDNSQTQCLVAYIVSASSVTSSKLRESLKTQLPDYMMPSAFVSLERLPLMPNGKIDHKALPIPDAVERESAYIAPRTPSEEIIANLFAVVLSVDNLGIHDNFFEMGGHSLLATQLMSRVREAFGLDIPLRTLFEAPTVSELEGAIAQQQLENNNQLALPPIQPRDTTDQLALSFAQERLWVIDRLEGSSALYNMPGAFRITGHLDIEALQKALSAIVARHEVLHTSFRTQEGAPVQVIQPEAEITIKLIDLQHLETTEKEDAVLAAANSEAQTPFALENAPLIRGRVLHLDTQEYVLLLTMHHIVSDGWSMGVLIQEVSSLYQAFSQGKSSPLPALPIQYADFALWQRQHLNGERLETQLNYWTQQLEGAPALLQLPTDRPRPSEQTYQGRTQSFSLNQALTQKLNELAQQSGTTLFMTLYAAFSTLLYRYSGQSDILIGSPIANRNRSEIEGLIGFFLNTLVLRARFEDDPSFQTLLASVRETTLKAYEHQDVPFEQIVEALQPERSLSHSPLFQVMFVLQNAPMTDIELPDLTLSSLELENTLAKFDLTLSMTETAGELVGSWEYNSDLFDGSTIARMAEHFENLLSAIVESPQLSVSELPLLSEAERDRILIDWNNTAVEYPKDKLIHELFEQQAEKTPDAIAVTCEGKQITYQALNQKANQLAHYLQSLGIKPDALVGICLDRSVEMVVGLLGILKAGGAYVPIDPNYPTERLSYMLGDSDVDVLLTQQSLRDDLPEHKAQTLCLDSDWDTIDQQSPENLTLAIDAQALAYVIYTSGSTGKPKGAMNTHQGIRNRLLWMQEAYQLDSSDRVLQKTPFSFDVSVWEFFWTLITGATLVIAKPEGHKDRDYLIELIVTEAVTTLHFVPSMLQAFLQGENVKACQCLKRVICSGEALPFDLTQLFFSQLQCELHNLYGPTEAAIDVSYWQCHPNADVQIVPIGKPIANTQLYILDKQLQPVPIGVAGELHIGGEGLARGYLNRVELTQERFIEISAQSVLNQEGRLYKTGDLARYLPDGNIEYLGRLDNQVKIRGFRIELGEIEAVLGHHDQVCQVVVIAQADSNGNKRLVAYVVADASLTHSQLRTYLKSKLPEYAIPAVFVQLECLPLTPNGKLDRKALPAPDSIERTAEVVEPRTDQEQRLVNIWKELLPVKDVGIHDNFFEIGGDSILSIQVISRAKNLGLQISAKQIFQYQTIAELASVAGTATQVECQQGLVTGAAPLTPIQQWFFSEQTTQLHHFNQSVLLQVPADVNPEILQQALAKLLEHHDALRLRFTKEGEDYRQTNHEDNHEPAAEAPLAVIDLSKTATAEQSQAIEKIATDFQASLDIEAGAVMQTVLFNLGDNVESRLLIIIHHLVVDGVSWRIVLEDLETLYQQLMDNRSIQLPAKTTAFIDWAKRLDEYGRSQTTSQELDYWLSQPWSMTSPLPLDCSEANLSNTVGDSQELSVTLSQAETTALLESSNEAYNTQINDILLSALGIALAEWTGTLKVLIALEGHGREEIFDDVDISRTVGWFTTLFPVLLDLPKGNDVASTIKATKEQLRAIPNRGIGFGILRYLSDPEVSDRIKAIPTPEICFNYLGQFDQIQSESGWQLSSESTGEDASPQLLRSYLLDINALIVNGELQINWTYSDRFHHKQTVEGLAQSYLQAIRRVIEHCQREEHSGYTPSDFPNADLEQSYLDELLDSFDL
ncbi:MAG: amino acid adenylation domain-containing protein, partial [Cyanobacteria bacterium J06649_4]